ncbi:MAG: ribosome maturation factor RimM [Clostridiales bacterium]|nr:ribosome maturation factor RimM [Clostridiales bacterium]
MEKIKIGKISGAQGLRGEVKLYHDSGDEEALGRLSFIFLHDAEAESLFKAMQVDGLRMQRRTPILKLEGIDDRDAAEALIGMEVYADKEESRPREKGAFFVSELIGIEVRLSDEGTASHGNGGDVIGRVVNVIRNPAHDILEIETDNGIRLLPFIDVFVREASVETGQITIVPPNGWLV